MNSIMNNKKKYNKKKIMKNQKEMERDKKR